MAPCERRCNIPEAIQDWDSSHGSSARRFGCVGSDETEGQIKMATPSQKQPITHVNYNKNFDDFHQAIIAAGLTPPAKIDDDGQIHRFSSNSKRGDNAGWYAFYGDRGHFGCFRLTLTRDWFSKPSSALTTAEQESRRRWIEDMKVQREAETKQRHKEAAKKAQKLWANAKPANQDHPYLQKKGVQPHGLRQIGDDLLLPITIDGRMTSTQKISPDGGKLFQFCGEVDGGHYLIGNATSTEALLIAEGFATAASLHEATGLPVICAFNAGNLGKAAKAMQKKYPGVSLMVCGDDDVKTDGNPGRTKAIEAAAACGGVAVFPSIGTDFNDMAQSEGPDAVKAIIAGAMPAKWFQSISSDEWATARLSPDCIVENYLFADVALLIAPGGVGKTTLILYEAICVTLGLPLYGRKIVRPGPVAILTAEDGRELLVARLNRIAGAMGLTAEQVARVQRSVLIKYVGSSPFRLTEVAGDVVVLSPVIDGLISRIKPLNPAMVVIDPAVSFGVGESRVNDAEQGLVMAARRIRDAVNCCVRYVHHTGKSNARDKTTDQYSGRGGSAFADGARMVAVLQSLKPDEWKEATGKPLQNGDTGMVLALPKLSYAPPQPEIFIERDGYSYRSTGPQPKQSAEEIRASRDAMVLAFVVDKYHAGIYYSKSTLADGGEINMTRIETREAIVRLITNGLLIERAGVRRGGKVLIPKAIADDLDEQKYREATGS